MRTIFLGSYAPNAVKGLINGSDREAAVKTLLASVGGKLETMMFTRGKYDVVMVAEFPDQTSPMGLTMAIRASGAFSDVAILEALDMDPIIDAAKKAAKIYEPAG